MPATASGGIDSCAATARAAASPEQIERVNAMVATRLAALQECADTTSRRTRSVGMRYPEGRLLLRITLPEGTACLDERATTVPDRHLQECVLDAFRSAALKPAGAEPAAEVAVPLAFEAREDPNSLIGQGSIRGPNRPLGQTMHPARHRGGLPVAKVRPSRSLEMP